MELEEYLHVPLYYQYSHQVLIFVFKTVIEFFEMLSAVGLMKHQNQL
jgi:hypothetical protein